MSHTATICSDGAAGPRRRGILLAAAIAVITLLVYLPVMSGGFFSDDYAFLVRNPLIQAPDGLRRIWFTQESADYFPLTSSLLWIEWRFWTNHPAGYHVVNVLLHAACAVLLWRLLRRLGVPGAWLAGVLFAVHPVAAASAAWITELKNTLSLLFCAASVLAYLKFDDATSQKAGKCEGEKAAIGPARCFLAFPRYHLLAYLLSLALFLLALLAKTSVVMLPAVLLLCAWWRRGRISRKDLLRSLPFFALSLVLGLVTVWFQWHNAIHGWVVHPEGTASRIATAGWVMWFYLYKILLPTGLCAIYPRWDVGAPGVLGFLPLLLFLGGMFVLWTRRKSWGRPPFFAVACFAVMLLPVLGFVNMLFMGLSHVADHLQYPAMIGIIALAAGLLARAAAAPGLKGRVGILATAGCVAALGIMSWDRARLYGYAEMFWQDNLARNPAATVWNFLGVEYFNAGRPDKAIPCFDRAIVLGLKVPVVYLDRGDARGKMGLIPQAIADYDAAIALQPDYVEAYCYRASALVQSLRFADAVRDCDTAIALKPGFALAYNNRAIAYCCQKQYDKALADVKKCLALGGRPDPAFLKALARSAARTE